MSNALLEVKQLSKHFRSHWTLRSIRAVENVEFEVFPDEAFGFLGHNGAGKTTTIKCIVGLLKPNRGQILFEGRTALLARERSKLGFLPEQPYFYDHLTVQETLEFFGSLYGMKSPHRRSAIASVLEKTGLAAKRFSKVNTLSKGLQQRLGLAQAILNQPRLLILDEPFSGLDPIGRKEVRELLLQLKSEGTTIFMSSHILSDVANICDRVGIMANGQCRSVFALGDMPRLYGEAFVLRFRGSEEQPALMEKICGQAESYNTESSVYGQIISLRFDNYLRAHRALSEVLAAGMHIMSFENQGLSLEEVFLRITQGKVKTEQASVVTG